MLGAVAFWLFLSHVKLHLVVLFALVSARLVGNTAYRLNMRRLSYRFIYFLYLNPDMIMSTQGKI